MRLTLYANNYTIRGFKIDVDRIEGKIKINFNSKMADLTNKEIANWIEDVKNRIGLGKLNPVPYWGFDDLRNILANKIRNCFYVVADSKIIDKHEYFKFIKLNILSGFSFDNLLNCYKMEKLLLILMQGLITIMEPSSESDNQLYRNYSVVQN